MKWTCYVYDGDDIIMNHRPKRSCFIRSRKESEGWFLFVRIAMVPPLAFTIDNLG